jgi:hypothetical protein
MNFIWDPRVCPCLLISVTHPRFGESRALDQIRLCLEHRAIEKTEVERMCSELRIRGDFDIAQISWRPDYDSFFYHQLSGCARRLYLFRGEYIFDLENAVVVETRSLAMLLGQTLRRCPPSTLVSRQRNARENPPICVSAFRLSATLLVQVLLFCCVENPSPPLR